MYLTYCLFIIVHLNDVLLNFNPRMLQFPPSSVEMYKWIHRMANFCCALYFSTWISWAVVRKVYISSSHCPELKARPMGSTGHKSVKKKTHSQKLHLFLILSFIILWIKCLFSLTGIFLQIEKPIDLSTRWPPLK